MNRRRFLVASIAGLPFVRAVAVLVTGKSLVGCTPCGGIVGIEECDAEAKIFVVGEARRGEDQYATFKRFLLETGLARPGSMEFFEDRGGWKYPEPNEFIIRAGQWFRRFKGGEYVGFHLIP